MFKKKQLLTENASPLKVKCFAECAGLNKAANKTQQFSASCLLGSPIQLLRSCLKDWLTGQIPRGFKLLGYLPPRAAAHIFSSGNLSS